MKMTDKISDATNIISAAANSIMALVAVYAAIKARNYFKSKFQDVIVEELSKIVNSFKEIEKNNFIFEIALPFRLIQPKSEWSDSYFYKSKVQGPLNTTISIQDCLKREFNNIKDACLNIKLHNGKISKKGEKKLVELFDLLFAIQSSLDEYHFASTKLFNLKVEREGDFISMHMFQDYNKLSFNERLNLFDSHIDYHTKNIKNLHTRILACLEELKALYAKSKFVK
ncbi:hypothetical protein [Enterobacter kobei]|uniref:hypothetical protein n=1 Tax=Enterobacter kobei TaxID=208224 RepID=UPI0039C4B356